MNMIKNFTTFILIITGLIATPLLNGIEREYVFGQKKLFETYYGQLEHEARHHSSNHQKKSAQQKQRVSYLTDTFNAAGHLDLLLKNINTSEQQSFALPLLNNDLCSLFNTSNPNAPIKPSSILGGIKFTQLLSTPLQSAHDSQFLENQALIELFKKFPELCTNVHLALQDLGKKTIPVFARKHTLTQWMEIEHEQTTPFYSNMSMVGHGVDTINVGYCLGHVGSRLINWSSTWLPSALSMTVPVIEPWNISLYCMGGILRYFLNSTRLQQTAQAMKAEAIKKVIDPFVQALQNFSTGFQATLHATENDKLISLADKLIIPENIATATIENVATIIQVLDSIGTVDACQALATAQTEGKIQPVIITNNPITMNMQKNNLEQGLATLWHISTQDPTTPWAWNGNALNISVKMDQPGAQVKSKQFLVNLILSQTIGCIISNTKHPIALPLLDTSKIGVTSMTRYSNNEKIEFVASIAVKPLPTAAE